MGIGDIFGGLGHGVLGLFGLGQLFDPLNDLRSKLASAESNMQNIINLNNMAVMQNEIKVDSDLYRYIQTNNAEIQEAMQNYNQLTMDDIKKENLFISILSALILIVIFFMLIK